VICSSRSRLKKGLCTLGPGVLQCAVLCCSVLKRVTVWYSVCCSVLKCVSPGKRLIYIGTRCVAVCCIVLQCVAVCCSVLQCVAVCCSVLQCVAVC